MADTILKKRITVSVLQEEKQQK